MSSQPDRSVSGSTTKTERRLTAYAAAAGAGLAAAGAAQAAIHSSGPQNIAVTSGGGAVNIDIDGDSTGDFNFELIPSTPLPSSTALAAADDAVGNALLITPAVGFPSFFVDKVSATFSVTSNLSFAASGLMGAYSTGTAGVNPGPWGAPMTGYLGFRLAGGELGWMKITINNAQLEATIHEWAWQTTPNTAIHVPDIPEPSAIATLVLGAAGVLARRRKRAG